MRVMMLAAAAMLGACASAPPADAPPPTLEGAWTVDLSPAGDGSYTKPMILRLAADGAVTGSFYESDIQAGRWKTARGRTCVSFRTTDGVGPYHTAACLVGTRVDGQTWAEHRAFLFNWSAVRGVE